MKPTLTYIGHSSYKLCAADGRVIYVDPFFKPGGKTELYDEPCDILLVTHNHGDHNEVALVTSKPGCTLITPENALQNGAHQTFDVDGIHIMAVQAYNDKHKVEECVGYVVELDGVKVYCSGDTSKTDDMSQKLAYMGLDYALLPTDGFYNMSPMEASECAEIMNVRHAIPIHNDPGATKTWEYSDKGIADFTHAGKIVLTYGQRMELV